MLNCILHGPCVGETLRSYDSVTEPEGVFVVIKFVRPALSADGGEWDFPDKI